MALAYPSDARFMLVTFVESCPWCMVDAQVTSKIYMSSLAARLIHPVDDFWNQTLSVGVLVLLST